MCLRCILWIATIAATLTGAESNQSSKKSTPLRLSPVVIPRDTNRNQSHSFVNITNVVYTSTHPRRKSHWVYTNHHFSIVNPPTSTNTHSGRVFELWKTSHQAHDFGCDVVAVNGGPYHKDGTSCGPLVVQGKLVQNVSSDWIGIGITDHDEWVLGNYHEIIAQWHRFYPNLRGHFLRSFVTGFHWLVYNGTVVAKDNDNEGGGAGRIPRAARTAVGVADDGTLVLLVVDGCEKWYDTSYQGQRPIERDTMSKFCPPHDQTCAHDPGFALLPLFASFFLFFSAVFEIRVYP